MMLFRTRRSRPFVDRSATAPGSGIDGGLEMCGVARWGSAVVVLGVDSGG
jgi:hypothetical protein